MKRVSIVRIVTAVTIAAVLGSGGLATARAAQVSGNSYESPTYGYSISWNAEFWSPVNELSENGVDVLVLQLGEGFGTFFLTGAPSSQQPADCVEGLAAARADSGNYQDYGRVSGREQPTPGGGGAGGLFGYTLVTQNGDQIPIVQYIECRPLVPGEAILIIVLDVIDDPQIYAAALLLYAELVGSLDVPSAGGQAEPPPDEEDEPQPEEEDEEDDRPSTSGQSGVDGNVYTSPSFGFTVTWDPAVWQVSDESSEEGSDYFEVMTVGGTSLVGLIAAQGYSGNAALCRDDGSTVLGQTEGITAYTPTPHVDTGEPLIGGDSALAFAIYDVTYSDENGTFQARAYLQCRTLVANRAVLLVLWIVPTELFSADLAAFEGLLAGIDTSEATVRPSGGSQPDEGQETDEEGPVDEGSVDENEESGGSDDPSTGDDPSEEDDPSAGQDPDQEEAEEPEEGGISVEVDEEEPEADESRDLGKHRNEADNDSGSRDGGKNG